MLGHPLWYLDLMPKNLIFMMIFKHFRMKLRNFWKIIQAKKAWFILCKYSKINSKHLLKLQHIRVR